MTRVLKLLIVCLGARFILPVLALDNGGVPKITFETNFFDFGKITAIESITGSFRFKNNGDGVLRVEQPQASCDCTEPKVKPETLQPGEAGEVTYTIRLDKPMQGQRFIRMRSNDPQNPSVQLNVQLDYTPLYDVSPKQCWVNLEAGKNEAQAIVTVTRIDGNQLGLEKFTTSEQWITAAFDPSSKAKDKEAKIVVTVHRPSLPPAPFSGKVHLWMSGRNDQAVQSIKVEGEVFGEVAARPRSLYWVVPDFGKDKSAYPAEALSRKIELTSVLGHDVQIEKVATDIEGLTVQLVPKEGKEAGKKFDLLLRFDQLPQAFTNGKVTVETKLSSLPRLEVPMTIAVAR